MTTRDRFLAFLEGLGVRAVPADLDDETKALAKSMIGCEDILPRACCDQLDIPQGSTYADGARVVLGEHVESED